MDSQRTQTVPVINTEVALRRLGGDTKLFATLAGFFLQDAPALMQQLHDSHHTGTVEMVFQSAHSLKGLAGTFEALPFVELAAEVETMARAGNLMAIKSLMSRLDFEFSRLVAHLQNSAT